MSLFGLATGQRSPGDLAHNLTHSRAERIWLPRGAARTTRTNGPLDRAGPWRPDHTDHADQSDRTGPPFRFVSGGRAPVAVGGCITMGVGPPPARAGAGAGAGAGAARRDVTGAWLLRSAAAPARSRTDTCSPGGDLE